jgi:hypothetical protein
MIVARRYFGAGGDYGSVVTIDEGLAADPEA